ncbi:MAG: DNA-directed RNA polymerase, subunit E'' [DPANN group archaeon]|nr:DNA-directed RNA polymerase, subunit E'' [DPANN group archaeon]
MAEKACKNCRLLVSEGDICPLCKESNLTKSWKGYVIVMNPEKSEIAQKLEIKVPGKYAIRITK